MLDSGGATLFIDGLWAISFGAGDTNSGSATELYFTSGPNDEADGVFGKLTATSTEQRGTLSSENLQRARLVALPVPAGFAVLRATRAKE